MHGWSARLQKQIKEGAAKDFFFVKSINITANLWEKTDAKTTWTFFFGENIRYSTVPCQGKRLGMTMWVLLSSPIMTSLFSIPFWLRGNKIISWPSRFLFFKFFKLLVHVHHTSIFWPCLTLNLLGNKHFGDVAKILLALHTVAYTSKTILHNLPKGIWSHFYF